MHHYHHGNINVNLTIPHQRKAIKTYSKRNRALARRIDHTKEINAQRHNAEVRFVVCRNPEGAPSHQQEKGHEGKRGEEQVSSTERIDRLYCW